MKPRVLGARLSQLGGPRSTSRRPARATSSSVASGAGTRYGWGEEDATTKASLRADLTEVACAPVGGWCSRGWCSRGRHRSWARFVSRGTEQYGSRDRTAGREGRKRGRAAVLCPGSHTHARPRRGHDGLREKRVVVVTSAVALQGWSAGDDDTGWMAPAPRAPSASRALRRRSQAGSSPWMGALASTNAQLRIESSRLLRRRQQRPRAMVQHATRTSAFIHT